MLGNQVVFGSVNANPRHFKQGVKDFARSRRNGRAPWPAADDAIPWENYNSWFTERGAGIKSTLEIA